MEKKTFVYWKVLALLLLILNITLTCFLLFRHPGGMPPFLRPGENPGRFLSEKLKFTDKQEADFDKLREAHHDSMMILLKEGKNLRKTFFNGLTSNITDTSKENVAGQIAQNQKQIELLTYRHFEKIKKLCTSDQQIIFNNILQDVVKRLENQPKEHPFKGRI